MTTGPVLRLLNIPLGRLTGEVGTINGSEFSAIPPNAQLWLARAKDVRSPATGLMAERIGTSRLALYLIGADVRIEQHGNDLQLVAPSTAIVGNLATEGGDPHHASCDGPGLAGPVYAIVR